MNDLTNPASLSPDLATLVDKVRHYVETSKAPNTRKAFKADWTAFSQWCEDKDLSPLPAVPQVIATYIADLAQTHKVATIKRRLSTISQAHKAAAVENPIYSSLVKATMDGITKEQGKAPAQKRAARRDDIKAMIETLPDGLLGLRDKALLLVGFAGGFRRSELVGLNVEDIEIRAEGMAINVRHSKTDQLGLGEKVGISNGRNGLCPVNALRRWLEDSGIASGPIFRYVDKGGHIHDSRLTDRVVSMVIKRAAERAGLDPAEYAGHSLRAGLATEAAANGAREMDIMRQTRHKSEQMVRRYVREANIFKNNVSDLLGL